MKPSATKILMILILAFGLRFTAGWWWQSRLTTPFYFGDSESYWTLAQSIAHGEGCQFGRDGAKVFRMPGYPALLAPIFWLAGDEPSVLWARAESAVLGTLTVGGIIFLAGKLFGAEAGLLAGGVGAIYPGLILMGCLVLSEAPFCLAMVVQLGLWTVAWGRPSTRSAVAWGVAAGMAGGVATLMRPSWLLFTPLAAGLAVAACRPWRRSVLVAIGLLVGLVAVMTPWWVRNARVTGRFVPTTLQVGASLYDGWNSQATGASDMRFVEPKTEEFRRREAVLAAESADTFEYRLDRWMKSEAFDWARQYPGEVVRLAGVKFLRLWNLWPNEPSLASWPVRLVVMGSYVPVLALGLWGAGRTLRRGCPYWLCWLPAVYLTSLHVVFVSSIRYREPVMLGWIVLASGVMVRWYRGGAPAPADGAKLRSLPSSRRW